MTKDDAIFFESPAAVRKWLASNHAKATEVRVGFYKKETGKQTFTWSEAVDEALCYGWIDGIRRSVDGERYANRFTPRRKTSHWSAVNLRRVQALIAEGRMRPAGLAAYEARDPARNAIYSFERPEAAALAPAEEARFRKQRSAWKFWEAQPPGYKRVALRVEEELNRSGGEESRSRAAAVDNSSCSSRRPFFASLCLCGSVVAVSPPPQS